jgi:tRNA A37 threonylcarbamoyladenosine synthetase subunit TsaC/SUA5/YrdC
VPVNLSDLKSTGENEEEARMNNHHIVFEIIQRLGITLSSANVTGTEVRTAVMKTA